MSWNNIFIMRTRWWLFQFQLVNSHAPCADNFQLKQHASTYTHWGDVINWKSMIMSSKRFLGVRRPLANCLCGIQRQKCRPSGKIKWPFEAILNIKRTFVGICNWTKQQLENWLNENNTESGFYFDFCLWCDYKFVSYKWL